MWQKALVVIGQLEQETKRLEIRAAPNTMAHGIELTRQRDEHMHVERQLAKEIASLRGELTRRDDELAELHQRHTQSRDELEHTLAILVHKDNERRNMIKKEYGYDEALLSLQNDVSDLETK